jgi:hypothetical protein
VLLPLAKKLEPLLSLRTESQVRLFASARLPKDKEKPAMRTSKKGLEGPGRVGNDGPTESQDAVHSEERNETGLLQERRGEGDGVSSGTETTDACPAEMRLGDLRTVLEESKLPFFVDLDAWSLDYGRSGSGHVHLLAPDPHLIPENVLNFVAYVPAIARQPLGISGEPPAMGFVMPGWGAVAFINQGHRSVMLPERDMAAYFGIFVHHFRELFSLPGLNHMSQNSSVMLLPPGKDILADWELDFLMRCRFRQLIQDTASATITLIDLVRFAEVFCWAISMSKMHNCRG